LHLIGTYGSILNDFITEGTSFYPTITNVRAVITTSPVLRYNPVPQILVGTSDGKILIYKPGEIPSTDPVLQDSLILGSNVSVKQITTDGVYIAAIASPINRSVEYKGFWDNQGDSVNFQNETPVKLALTKDNKGNYVSVVLTNENNFYIISGNSIIAKWSASPLSEINAFALADLKQDGEDYVVYNDRNTIEARNFSGALADNFPFKDPDDKDFTSNILTADFEGNNNSEIIASTVDGRIFAIDGGTGKTIYGFPISAGSDLITTPVLFTDSSRISYAALNEQLNFSGWNIGMTEGTIFRGEEYENPENSGFVKAASAQNRITSFMPENRAYNYPNPVYEGKTYIRYYVSEDAKINIKIFDLAGDFVAELNDEARGGLDNETVWNVGDIQSGVYLARIEATSSSGKSDSRIIKIAVVK
jgi:hypothetical protein